MKREIMSPQRLTASLSVPDLTDEKNGVHAINIVVNRIRNLLQAAYPSVALQEYRIDPRVPVTDNFDELLFPADNAGRSSIYTRYVDEHTVLRTHTSAAIPRWLRESDRSSLNDVLVMIPGMCYRRDVVDRTHCGEPHQLDVWRVRRGERLGRNNLRSLIEVVVSGLLPGYEYRLNEVEHPYTVRGLEVEVYRGDSVLEVLECGEMHPTLLQRAGLDPSEYSGLAMGMGLDRLVMLLKGIDDIRVLRSGDPRIAAQMKDIEPYEQVSNQPAAPRVLSYATSLDMTEEDVCEEIMDALGDRAKYVEEIRVEALPYDALPEKARANLGMRNDQQNIVATLIMRSLEGTLPRATVNDWMREIYPKLNKGEKGYM